MRITQTRIINSVPAILLPLLLAVTMFSQAPAEAVKGRLITLSINSEALKGNLLGDPSVQEVDVYLPPGYSAEGTTRYPVIYLLHGYTGDKEEWTNEGYQGMSLADSMNELISSGKSKPMIVVAPNARNAYLGSYYTDSPVTGGWATYISKELVGRIDRDFQTIANASGRGIAGHSMGGYGAIMLAMKNPDIYTAVYGLSPCCLGFEDDFGPSNGGWKKATSLSSREDVGHQPESFEDFYAVAFLAMAAALSPAPDDGPMFVTYPFAADGEGLKENKAVLALWKAKMPLYLVEEMSGNLKKLKGIRVDYGEKEEFPHIRSTTRMFSQKLSENGVPHGFEIYADGDHGSRIRERFEKVVIPFFSEILDDPR